MVNECPVERYRYSSDTTDAKSSHSTIASESKYNQDALLEMSDSVRLSLLRDNALGPWHEKLSSFLHTALRDEEMDDPVIDLDRIQHARLDKLLNELLNYAESVRITKFSAHFALGFRVDMSNAKNLRRAWRRRYREQYFMLDQRRCAVMVEGGHLKDVSFNACLIYNLSKWQTIGASPVSEIEANLQFEPGHWWLNITCAERDGIVAGSSENLTKGRYGIPTLPLLSGREEIGNGETGQYIREGTAQDMHFSLISQVGRQIRILRGHGLKSIFAPQAGLRYDGLYVIKRYGHKHDEATNVHRLVLTLERVPGQRPMEETQMIPRPAQLDDWALYEKLEGDKIKMLDGEATYLEWKLTREREKIEREDWRRARLFRASVQ
ncbi:PUA-like domain-containing protein [Microdochium trichocladiopsis]|uniref:PUA-like domain-containing protein n=1 Tax=Microdochium trichocladiopsis TaxID=1682393 RepID=A0A9P9BSI9_9PEZI|nr:PUA-like domain-containing protein [Microdochium trichocladiopsis]KAH7037945.1 PUA-like domain-containing protein [Microdochium trichocladiopsis]